MCLFPKRISVTKIRHIAKGGLNVLLEAEHLRKSYPGSDGDVEILKGVSLTLSKGETLALTGESGSGKSTLLHIIGGLEAPDAGKIVLEGRDVTGLGDAARAEMRRTKIGVIFQQFNLIPSLSVADNISFQARLADRFDRSHAEELTRSLGLSDHVGKYPEALSGGQQQRVAIARTLAARPALVLADEPTGNLDEDTAADVLHQMRRLVIEAGSALMVVTHSNAVAGAMDRHLHLRSGQLT